MTRPRGILLLLTLCGAVSRDGEGIRTEITVGEGPEREVRFASGATLHVEALVEGCWIGRSWNAQGRWERSVGHCPEPAFPIEVRERPAAKQTSLVSGRQWVSEASNARER